MIWFQKDKIPAGNWPFLNTTYAGLREFEEVSLFADVDLTEGQEDITISGCMEAYRQIILRRVIDLVQSVVITWNSDNYVGSIVCARALLETLAVFNSFLTRAKEAINKKDWDAAFRLVTAYAFSTSQGQNKHKKTSDDPPRISGLVKTFTSVMGKDKEKFWEQICDHAHPNGESMLYCLGELQSKHLYAPIPGERVSELFVAIYNCIYSVCWLEHVRHGYC